MSDLSRSVELLGHRVALAENGRVALDKPPCSLPGALLGGSATCKFQLCARSRFAALDPL
jgi:hypothetical protein